MRGKPGRTQEEGKKEQGTSPSGNTDRIIGAIHWESHYYLGQPRYYVPSSKGQLTKNLRVAVLQPPGDRSRLDIYASGSKNLNTRVPKVDNDTSGIPK